MRVFVLTVVLLVSAHVMFSHPMTYRNARINNVTLNADPPDNAVNCSSGVYPYMPDVQSVPEMPSSLAPEWGTDRLVSDAWQMTGSVISMDYDADGYIYVMGISKNMDHDSLKLYKSTDGGLTWSLVWSYVSGYDWEIWDVEMRVNHTGTEPDVYFFIVDSSTGTYDSRLWFGIIEQHTMTVAWTAFDPNTNVLFANPLELSMDISDDATPFICCSYTRTTAVNYGWNSLRSTDGGTTWSVWEYSGNRGGRDPYVSVGTDYFYEICIYTSVGDSNGVRLTYVPIGTNYGPFLWVSDSILKPRTRPCVATTRENYPTNMVEVMYEEGANNLTRVKESYSTNGGLTWTLGQLWPMTGDVWSESPYVRSGWAGTARDEFCAVGKVVSSMDSLVGAYNYTGTWIQRVVPNEHDVSSEVLSQCTLTPTGSIVAWREYGSNNVWFDSYQNVAVEETPSEILRDWNISNHDSGLTVSFTLSSPENVSLNMYDVLGRNVLEKNFGTLSEGSHTFVLNTGDMTSGRYFVSVRSGDQNLSKSIVLF